MDEILISVHQEWIALMAVGLKDGELRKTWPKKLEPPFKVRLYCTKEQGSEVLLLNGMGGAELGDHRNAVLGWQIGNGHVVGEFICTGRTVVTVPTSGERVTPQMVEVNRKAHLTYDEIIEYLGLGREGSLWHMRDLVIYPEPQPLMRYVSCAFDGYCGTCSFWDRDTRSCREIVRAPQSWRYIKEVC